MTTLDRLRNELAQQECATTNDTIDDAIGYLTYGDARALLALVVACENFVLDCERQDEIRLPGQYENVEVALAAILAPDPTP